MRSPGINGEGELRGQPANPGSPGKMTVKTECVCVCVCAYLAGDKHISEKNRQKDRNIFRTELCTELLKALKSHFLVRLLLMSCFPGDLPQHQQVSLL